MDVLISISVAFDGNYENLQWVGISTYPNLVKIREFFLKKNYSKVQCNGSCKVSIVYR